MNDELKLVSPDDVSQKDTELDLSEVTAEEIQQGLDIMKQNDAPPELVTKLTRYFKLHGYELK